VLPAESPIKGEILVSQLRSLDALARPVRFSGVKVDGRVLADVKRKIAFLCEISPGDIAEA